MLKLTKEQKQLASKLIAEACEQVWPVAFVGGILQVNFGVICFGTLALIANLTYGFVTGGKQ